MELDEERKESMVWSLVPRKIAMVQANVFLLELPSNVYVILAQISVIFFFFLGESKLSC